MSSCSLPALNRRLSCNTSTPYLHTRIRNPFKPLIFRLPPTKRPHPTLCFTSSSVGASSVPFRICSSSGITRLRALTNDAAQPTKEPRFLGIITSRRVIVVLMLAFALALINLNRAVLSVPIVPDSKWRGLCRFVDDIILSASVRLLSRLLGWRQSFDPGVLRSSFLCGHLISPIAGGTLVDHYGGEVVMAWGVGLWSLAILFTPWTAESSLVALRGMWMLLGIVEGVMLPCMSNMIARWFPQVEKSRAVGLAMVGFQLGSAFWFTLSPVPMSQDGINGPFMIFSFWGPFWLLVALFGFLWVMFWVSLTSRFSSQSPLTSTYEMSCIERKIWLPSVSKNETKTRGIIPPLGILLSKLPTWSLIFANAMHSWGSFVILSWMPIYFKKTYRIDLGQAAVPWRMMALIGCFAGVLSDMMIQWGTSVTLTRKIMQSIGFVGPALALIGLTMARSPFVASAWLTLAVGLKSFSLSGFFVNIQEIAPQYTGVLHGMANTAGTLAAILGMVGACFYVESIGSFNGFLLLTASLYFFAALFWNIFSTGERVDFVGSA